MFLTVLAGCGGGAHSSATSSSSSTTTPTSQTSAPRCLPARDRPAAPAGEKSWVAWTTPQGWLHVGTRAELAQVQPVREEIWGGTGDTPIEKRALDGGPWATREDAVDAICARLTDVRLQRHPAAHPGETVVARLDGGADVNLMLSRGMLPDDVFWTAQQYDHGAQLADVRSCGITPRITFDGPRWLAHATGVGTMDGPRAMDTWFLLPSAPTNGGFTLPDGSGGTFGYSSDRSFGPFADNFALIPQLRELGLTSLGDISTDTASDPPIDHGLPRCPR